MRNLLMVVLALVACGAAFYGFSIMGNADSAIHEIEALICFVIAVVALAGWAVTLAVDNLISQGEPPKPLKP